jgi:hypothetical protein
MNRERRHDSVRLRRVLKCAGLMLLAASPGVWAQARPGPTVRPGQTQAPAQEQARPQEASWGFDLGGRYTDNVARVDEDEQSETVGIAGVNFILAVNRPRLVGSAAADLHYEKYFDNTFDPEVNGGLDGLLSYAFVPERFLWTVQDNYGQVSRNRQAADTPANRQDINYFSTGPDITLPLGARTSFQVSGRWSDAYYEEDIQDSEDISGSVALVRTISSSTLISLNGSHSEVDYDEDNLFIDYQVEQAFLRFQLIGARTTIVLDGGVSRIEQDGDTSESENLLANLDVTRLIGARSTLRLVLGTAPSTSAQTFRRDQELGGVDVGAGAAVTAGDSFQSDYAYLTFATDWERSAFTAFLSARSEDHETFNQDNRDQYRATLTYFRDLTRNFTLDVHGTYLDEKFTETGFAFDEWGGGLGARWQLGRRLALVARVDHFVGSSDNNSRDYTENRAYLGISYSSNSDGY